MERINTVEGICLSFTSQEQNWLEKNNPSIHLELHSNFVNAVRTSVGVNIILPHGSDGLSGRIARYIYDSGLPHETPGDY